jgi:hypothetical protein
MLKHPKRPRDLSQLAKLIVDISTGERPNDSPTEPESQITKVRRAAGIRGGKARARTLSPRRRKAIARKGGKASHKR